MSKRFKAIICALTAGMMLFTSSGLSVFAEETKADGSAAVTETRLNADGSEAVATEQPETVGGADVAEDEKDADVVADIEASQATEEPAATPVPKGYDADTYYQNALQVVSALGIITGYDDGSIKPESTVTRAEMATIILRMIASAGTSTYQNVFTDVEASHWAADTIQTAVEQKIVDGMGDGTFVPDGPVKYEQVIKMIVCAMNYGVDAENAGGYPTGYVSVGGSILKLLAGVSGATGEDMPRGEVIKAVFNALKASYRDIKEFKNGYPVYEAKDTLGVEKFKMYEDNGVLTTTPNLTIARGTTTKEGVITIDGVDYKCDFNVDKFVASKIKFYYIDDKSDDNKVIALFSMGRSQENTFDAVNIDKIDTAGCTLRAYASTTSSSKKTYNLSKDATVVYNDTIMTTADLNSYLEKKNKSGTVTYDDFLKPKVGNVRIVDYDDDGKYDIIFVNSYETMLVINATTEKLTGKINKNSESIEYDLDDKAYEIHVTKSDVEASVKNLKKNDVASIKRNLDGDKITIVVTGESITGSITGIGTEDDETTATINGQTYKVDTNAVDDMQTGVSGTFYLDQFDRIGYASLVNSLVENEKYAMIAKAYYNDEAELVIRLFNSDGKQIEAKPANGMKYWAPGATTASPRPSEDGLYNDLNGLNPDAQFITCNGNPIKLCKYTLNGKGELSKLYVAVGTAKLEDDSSKYNDALVINSSIDSSSQETSDMRYVPAVGGTLDGYTINDGIIGFNVPDNEEDRGTGANYSVNQITASRYKSYDNGVDIHFVIGGFTTGSTKTAKVLVEFTTSSNSMYTLSELDTASIRPVLIVSKINKSVDADDETVYTVVGYQAGSEVSYTTTKTTSVYKFTGWDDSRYGGDLLFDATGENSSNSFTSVVEPGDIVALGTNGSDIRSMIIMAEAEDVAKTAVKGTIEGTGLVETPKGSSAKGSSTRQSYYMAFVSSVSIDESAFIGLRNIDNSITGAVTYNTSQVFSYVTLTVNENGKITDVKVDKNGGMEPSEIYAWGDKPDTYDFFVCSSLKGGMSNGYVVRVVINR